MLERTFHATEIQRSFPVLEALALARTEGRLVSDAFFEEGVRFLDEDLHRERPALVELTFYRLGTLTAFDHVLVDLDDQRLRPADLLETLALMRRRPELFLERGHFPLQIIGERIRAPQVSKKDCIAVFPEDGAAPPPPLWLVERGNYLGSIVILAAKKTA